MGWSFLRVVFSQTRKFTVNTFTGWIYCIEIFFTLLWKTEFAVKFSTVLNIFFTIQDFWETCACPQTQSLPWKFSLYWIYFYIQVFEQLDLALKNKACSEFTALNIYFSSFRIFEQLALALKNTSCPEMFHRIEIFLSFRIFEQLALALIAGLALNSLYWIYIFYHSGFLSNLRLPWNFSGRGGDRPPASYAYVGNSCLRWTACFNRVSRLCKIYWTRFNSKILCLDSGILSRSVTGIDLLDHCCRARHKSSNQKSWLESSDIESLTRISNLL